MSEIVAFPRDKRKALATLAVLFFTASLCTIDRFVINLMVDPIRADLAISETQMSLLQGLAFSLFYSLAGLPIGLLADRRSRRNLLMGGVALWSAATALAGFAQSYETMFTARVLVGAGEATLWPVAVSMIGDLFEPEDRGKAISSIILGQIVGSSASLFGGGLLLAAAANGAFSAWPVMSDLAPWRTVLLLCAAAGAVMLVFLALTSEPVRRVAPPPRERSFVKPFVQLARNGGPAMGLIMAAAFLLSSAVYSMAAWTAPFYIRHFGMDPARVGALLGAIGLGAGVAGTFLAGILTDRAEKQGRRPAKASLAVLTCLGCVPAALIAFSPNVSIALACTALGSVCFPMAGSSIIILLQDLAPANMRGFAIAVNHIIGGLLGASAGPLLAALATEHIFQDDKLVGSSLALVVLPSLMLAAAMIIACRRLMIRAATRPA